MNSFYFVLININFKFRSTSGSPCNQEVFFSRFPESMNQTLRQTTVFGLCEFATCVTVKAARSTRLRNLRESVFPLGVFHFALYPNPELKTSEFSLRYINQIPRFYDFEFSILHYTQTENSELKTSAKVYPSNDFVHCPEGLFDIWNKGC